MWLDTTSECLNLYLALFDRLGPHKTYSGSLRSGSLDEISGSRADFLSALG